MNAPARIRYPRKVEVKRLIDAARAAGLDVAGVEFSPDGSIRLLERSAVKGKDLFDEWEDRL